MTLFEKSYAVEYSSGRECDWRWVVISLIERGVIIFLARRITNTHALKNTRSQVRATFTLAFRLLYCVGELDPTYTSMHKLMAMLVGMFDTIRLGILRDATIPTIDIIFLLLRLWNLCILRRFISWSLSHHQGKWRRIWLFERIRKTRNKCHV